MSPPASEVPAGNGKTPAENVLGSENRQSTSSVPYAATAASTSVCAIFLSSTRSTPCRAISRRRLKITQPESVALTCVVSRNTRRPARGRKSIEPTARSDVPVSKSSSAPALADPVILVVTLAHPQRPGPMPRASTSRPAFRDIAQASTLQHATRIFVFIGKTGGPGLTGTAGATCLAIRGEGIVCAPRLRPNGQAPARGCPAAAPPDEGARARASILHVVAHPV